MLKAHQWLDRNIKDAAKLTYVCELFMDPKILWSSVDRQPYPNLFCPQSLCITPLSWAHLLAPVLFAISTCQCRYPHAVSIPQSAPSNLSSLAFKTMHLERAEGSPRTQTLDTQPPHPVAPPGEGLLRQWWRAWWSQRHHTRLLPCVPRSKTTAMETLVACSTLHITHIRDSRSISGLLRP